MDRSIYVIGDIHGDYKIIDARFGDLIPTNGVKDVLFVAGDAGFINSFENENSKEQRIKHLNSLPFTIIVVLGNHENYDIIESLPECSIFNAKCYIEDGVEVYYAKNGQVFDIDGTKIFTFNGGLSIDKEKRLEHEKQFGKKFWWPQEIITEEIQDALNTYFTKQIEYDITHDVPLDIFKKLTPYIPARFKDAICPLQDFFQKLYTIKKFKHWYAGHYHPSFPINIDKFTVLPIGYLIKIK